MVIEFSRRLKKELIKLVEDPSKGLRGRANISDTARASLDGMSPELEGTVDDYASELRFDSSEAEDILIRAAG